MGRDLIRAATPTERSSAVRVELSNRAREDIFGLAEFASEYSERAVYRIADEVDRSRKLISQFPESGRERPELGEGIRVSVNRALGVLFVYVIRDDHALVTRVVDARSDYVPDGR